MTNPVRYESHGEIAVIRIDNPPVNASSLAVRAGLVEAAATFAKGPEKVAVLMAEGRTFIAGADITEFGKTPTEPYLPDAIMALESLEKPVVCVIHGTALGGGFEVALGCHYRVMLRGAKVGLPEVNLGLIPGAGGTQRLPRLVGIVSAADIFTSARQVSAEDAFALGIADELSNADPFEAGMEFARKVLAEGLPVRRLSEMSVPPTDADSLAALKKKVARANPGHICHLRAIDVAVAGADKPFDEAMLMERGVFLDMMATPQRKAMIHAFFSERKTAQLPELKGVTPRTIRHVGVIGGGTMGGGIAVSCLLNGLHVTLIERDGEAVEKAHTGIARTLADSVKRGKLSAGGRDQLLADKLVTTDDYEALSTADVIIEAVFESMDVKKDVFTKLDAVAKPGAVLASNTSYLDVDEIAAMTSRPQDVIGLHFFSPAHVMRLLEIVVAAKTAPEVVATGFALAKALKKVPVRAGVCDGFIGNRILKTYRTAADIMVLEGASPFQVDKALVDFGFAMGPYAVADLAGIDIGYLTRKRLLPTRQKGERWGDWGDKLYEMGRLGRKTGHGHYIYDDASPKGRPDPEVEDIIAAERKAKGINARDFTDEEIVERYMAAMINEGAKVVSEGIALRPLDVDVTKLYGYGFPRFRGGPMHYADHIGLAKVLATIEAAAKDDAFFWQPADLLKTLVAEGRDFNSLN
ncbi:3-hydroxyacyl-CoA dehydrogenase NAD-binding domain-containing protein [Pararhodobacter zhoushanensis]|uniref:3-hydroxyacyl-CoA dehydrogenase NAD-binding domain-containing protein n=1 Tax=Pararhodobacter zhoushanensis TaxID=2479545 RepID=A0ABT3H4I0_9RHOB|nr:3-hydroxyacyl-CoA dehydrogenase NAD-binding domain-containing protein [Pararhodobacter zhoushanensis]MCW1934730.1 3-hydroxyacyl-CoA dehydrogenase NAD-binding domain-containing protein [Pararhodobacter zhoushanensis]